MSSSTNQQSWMHDMSGALSGLALNEVALPGTHDSGTYGISNNSGFSPDKPTLQQHFGSESTLDREVQEVTAGWAVTQGLTITQQLMAGIRYLDLRICTGQSGDVTVYVCHAMYSITVDAVIDEVGDFVNDHPQETVILDFNHFYGLSDDQMKATAAKLVAKFGIKIVPGTTPVTTTLGDIWNAGQQVIIFFHGTQHQCQESYVPVGSSPTPEFWSQDDIRSCWPQAQTLSELQAYMQNEIEHNKPTDKLWVVQGIMTEDAAILVPGLLSGPNSLQAWAPHTTTEVVQWIQSSWTNSGLNIVIVDWFHVTDYVATIINLNNQG